MKHLAEKTIDYLVGLLKSFLTAFKEWRKGNSDDMKKAFDDVMLVACGHEAIDETVWACSNGNAALAREHAYDLAKLSIRFIQEASDPLRREHNNALWYHTKLFLRYVECLELASETAYVQLLEEYRWLRLHLQDVIFDYIKAKANIQEDDSSVLSFWIVLYSPTPA